MRRVNLAIFGHGGVHGLKIILGRNACRHLPHCQRLSGRVAMGILLGSSLSVVQVGASHPGSPATSGAFTWAFFLAGFSSVLTVRVGLCRSPVTYLTRIISIISNNYY